MRLKYKVVLTLFISSFVLGYIAMRVGTGYTAGLIFLVAMILFVMGLSAMTYADRNDRKLGDIMTDAVFGIFH